MFSRFGFHGKVMALIGFVVIAAAGVFSPACAHADETTRVVDWDMTITLQNTSKQAPSGTGTSGLALTGGSVFLLAVGVLALIAGAVYMLCIRRRLAGDVETPARRRLPAVAVAAALVAGLCAAVFACGGTVARADESRDNVQGVSTVKVDELGNVLGSSIAVSNGSNVTITIAGAQAPERLKGWTAHLPQSSVEPGGKVSGSWNAKTIPSDVLNELKNNGGKLNLTMKATIDCQVDPVADTVAYTVNHHAENLDGTYPVEPTQTETLSGTEGDSTQAKALEIEGFTAQEFEQTTIKPDGTSVVPIKYSRNSYKVTFDGNGHQIDTAVQNVKFGATVARPADPTAGGLTFDGWFIDAECTVAYDFEKATMPAEDVTLYAKWSLTPIDFGKASVDMEAKTYTGSQIKPTVSIPGLTEGTDYKVTYGENTNAGEGTITIKGTGNYTGEKTYTFPISPAIITVSGITAKDKNYDGTATAELDCSGAVLTGLVAGDKLSVSATGTFEDANVGEGKKVIISDLTLSGADAANYRFAAEGQQQQTTASIIKVYTITYNNIDGATNPNPQTYTDKTGDITLTDATKTGNTFDGWYDKDGSSTGDWGNKVTTIPSDSAKDVTLYAKWTVNTYTVNFVDTKGGKNSSKTVKYGEKLTAPSEPKDDADNLLLGWCVENPTESPEAIQWDFATDTMPANDITLYTKWHKKYCEVIYLDTDGTKFNAQTVIYGHTTYWTSFGPDDVSNPEVKDGKVFNDWYVDAEGTEKFDFSKPITEDTTIYAKRYDYGYWLGYAENTAWPMKDIVKSPDELAADIKVLKDEAHTQYSKDQYDKVKVEYTTFMNEDKVRLYTYYGGYDIGNLMVFRIIEVGRHDRGDGTLGEGVLTFQATCSLPEGETVHETETNVNWMNSDLREHMLNQGAIEGSISRKFDQRLKSAMATVSNAGFEIGGQMQYCDDKLFVLSYTELTGNALSSAGIPAEGTQYAFYKDGNNLKADKLREMGNTITGGNPKGTPDPYDSSETSTNWTTWWTRTPAGGNKYYIVENGSLYNIGDRVTLCRSVVVAFAM